MRPDLRGVIAIGTLLWALGSHSVAAQAPQPSSSSAPSSAGNSQQQRMGACNTGAGTRNLAGQERQRFMSDCLAGRIAPTDPTAATTASPSGTPAQQAQRARMLTCNSEVAQRQLTGTDRSAFMSSCLSKR